LQEIDALIGLLQRLQREQMLPPPSYSAEQYEMIREAHQRHKERLESQMQLDQSEEDLQPNQQNIEAIDAKRGGCKLYQQAESIQILLLSDANH
jgi:ABC-type transporter lipoprotein component MlaA